MVFTFQACCSQTFNKEDLNVIKLYPAIERMMINPTQVTFISSQNIKLSYILSEGKDIEREADKYAASGKTLAKKEEQPYLDGASEAWLKGIFYINDTSYKLYGSYVAEGYLQGVLYDARNNVFGVLYWSMDKNMTATLKTSKYRKEYNLFVQENKSLTKKEQQTINKNAPQPSKSTINALNEILRGNNDKKEHLVEEQKMVTGYVNLSSNTIEEFYIGDILKLENLPHSEKCKLLLNWGWSPDTSPNDSIIAKSDLRIVFTKKRSTNMKELQVYYLNAKKKKELRYEITNCNQAYIDRFIADVKNKGFDLIEDKKVYCKLKNMERYITIRKADINYGGQNYTIVIK